MLGGNSMATLRLIPSTITDASQYPGVGYIYIGVDPIPIHIRYIICHMLV